MEQWERDGLRSANFGVRNQVEHTSLDPLAEQPAQVSEVYEQLPALDPRRGPPRAPPSNASVAVAEKSTDSVNEQKCRPENAPLNCDFQLLHRRATGT
jgi:hypothetical protein